MLRVDDNLKKTQQQLANLMFVLRYFDVSGFLEVV